MIEAPVPDSVSAVNNATRDMESELDGGQDGKIREIVMENIDGESEIGSISSDIKVLQEKSMDMGLKLKNRKVAESKLAKFVEDIIVPPRMVDIIVDSEVENQANELNGQEALQNQDMED